MHKTWAVRLGLPVVPCIPFRYGFPSNGTPFLASALRLLLVIGIYFYISNRFTGRNQSQTTSAKRFLGAERSHC